MKKNMKYIDILKDNGIMPTKLRLKIFSILKKSNKALSYDEILQLVDTNKTTFYRTMKVFEEAGITIKTEHDCKSFYEISSDGKAYFICDICHQVTNIDVPHLKNAKKIKSVLIKGTCNNCD